MYVVTDNTVCAINRNKFHLGLYRAVTVYANTLSLLHLKEVVLNVIRIYYM
jgi:hypothetical protein